jgi:hypothetical protein
MKSRSLRGQLIVSFAFNQDDNIIRPKGCALVECELIVSFAFNQDDNIVNKQERLR